MKITFNYKFAFLSKENYRNFPILHFAYGKNGFLICILGFSVIFKF